MRLLSFACTSALLLTGSLARAQGTTTVFGTTSVGQTSLPMPVTVKITTGGTAASVSAVTQGAPAMDFAMGALSLCAAGATYNAGDSCLASVTFSPKYPGVRSGAVTITDANGVLLGSALLSGLGKGGLGVFNPAQFESVAGSSAWIYRGDGIPATQAQIFLPAAVVGDTLGNIYIADSGNNRIRKVSATTQLISTVAGNGTPGYSGDGGLATAASISNPSGLALDGAGNLYFVDSGNEAVRRVDASSGIITTVAGTAGAQGYAGDGGAATAAKLSLPEGLAIDMNGNMYIGDTGNNAVREVVASTGLIKTIAGLGQPGYNGDNQAANKAMLNSPWGVAVSGDGTVYVADLNNHRIRKISLSGTITTVAGTGSEGAGQDGGQATASPLNSPAAVAVDAAGNLYIADSGNNRMVKVYANTGVFQIIINDNQKLSNNSTYDPQQIFAGYDWPDVLDGMYGPYSVYVDQAGNLFIAELFDNIVVEAYATAVHLHYDTIRVGKVSPAQPVAVENDGNDTLTLSAPVFSGATLDSATTTCTGSSVLTAGNSCTLGVEFAPTTVGTLVTGTLTQGSDAANSPGVMTLTGQVLSVNPTTITLTSNENPSLIGDIVTFTATVSNGIGSLTGTVDFLDGKTVVCSQVSVNSNGIATCALNNLALGQHSMTAAYGGDTNDAAVTSNPALIQVVQQASKLVLGAAPNPATVGQNVTLTAQASAATGTPTGTIAFYDGATLLASVPVDGSGQATTATTQLAPGPHSLSAKYSGDTNDAASASNLVSEQINQMSTMTLLSTSNGNVPVGTVITFTAMVSNSNGATPTGTVKFTDGKQTIGSATLVSGTATLNISTLVPGAHSIVATYAGDTNDAGSSSSALTETVQQIGTTTALVSDANPANAGATVHLTATVAIAAGATADGAITGTVTFTDGTATVCNQVPLTTGGTAVCAVSNLTVTNHSIVATYSGSTNYASSASGALIQTVQSTTTTTALSSSNPNALAGKPVTFTASVTSATGGIPTGTVTFKDGSTILGTGTLDSKGVATYASSALSVSSHNIVAVYAGDNNYSGSTSPQVVEVISLATTGLTLTGPANAVDAGLQVSMSEALTGNGVAPTGSLVLKDGGTVVNTQNVTNTGTFTFNTSTMSIGTHTMIATYGGDGDNATATSNTLTITVQQATSSTTLTSSLNPAVLGQNVIFTATVTSDSPSISGAVNFMDGSNVIGSSPVSSGVATLSTSTLIFGQHTITAVYAGDTNHSTSTSVGLNETIVQPAMAAVISSLNPAVSGNNVTFTAKITGVGSLIPTGKATFTDGAATLGVVTLDGSGSASFSSTTLAVGSHNIAVGYAGDGNYSTATASLIETIGNANTTVALTASANPAVYGTPLSFTAVITSNGGTATGTVTFTDGSTTVGTGVLDATGTATMSTSTLTPTTHNIVANYGGDGKAGASASTPLAIVVKQMSAVTVLSSSNPENTLNPITFTAAVTNAGASQVTGTVTFMDGSTNLGTATLDGAGHASVAVPSMTAGNHPITVSYTGDTADFASVSGTLTQGVTLRPTTTTLTSTATDPNNPLSVTLISVVHWNGTATAPTGKVTFKTGSTTIGSAAIDGTGVATLTITLDAQTESVIGSYNGDTAYAASDSLATNITGGVATQFTMSLDPPNATLQSKQRTTVNLTLTSVKSFTDMMQFGCLGLPYAATCTFSKTAATLPANGTMNVQLTVDTGDPLGSGASTTASNTHLGSSNTVLAFLPVGLLVGLALMRRRKRAVPALLLALCALAVTMGVTGCSGLQTSGTPAGTYTFKVTASGQGTGATQSSGMTLTVTQ